MKTRLINRGKIRTAVTRAQNFLSVFCTPKPRRAVSENAKANLLSVTGQTCVVSGRLCLCVERR